MDGMWKARFHCFLAFVLTVDLLSPRSLLLTFSGSARLTDGDSRRLWEDSYQAAEEEEKEAERMMARAEMAQPAQPQNTSDASTEDTLHYNITIPCVKQTFDLYFINYTIDAIHPCGVVPVEDDALTIKVANGYEVHLPNATGLEVATETVEREGTKIMIGIVGVGLALYAIYFVVSRGGRQVLAERLNNLWHGKIDPPNPHLSREEQEEQEVRRLSVDSEDFICPGNMFRVLAVLRPDKIGWLRWSGRVFETMLGLGAQFFVPMKIYANSKDNWVFDGIKSPLWLLQHSGTFVLRCVSMALLCKLFAMTCQKELISEVEADVFLMTHREKHPDDEESVSSDDDSLPAKEYDTNCFRRIDRTFCSLSACQLMAKCCLLFVAMFMTIATFDGEYQDAVIKLSALYLVFDLDRKMVTADSELRTAYRFEVKKRVQPVNGYHPRFLPFILGLTADLMHFVTPLGVAATFAFAWKDSETGEVIGGDPWELQRNHEDSLMAQINES